LPPEIVQTVREMTRRTMGMGGRTHKEADGYDIPGVKAADPPGAPRWKRG